MRASRIAARAALVCGLAGAAWCTWSSLDANAAHADEPPAAVTERPGGPLGAVINLPGRTADVVDQVLPTPGPSGDAKPPDGPQNAPAEKPTQAPTEQPAEEPAPDGSTSPASPSPVDGIVDDATDELGQIGDTVDEAVQVTPSPTPSPAATQPVSSPAPTQPAVKPPVLVELPRLVDAPAITPAPALVEAAVPPAPAPVDLPVPIGPVLGRTLDDGIRPTEPAATRRVEVGECGHDTRILLDVRRALRALVVEHDRRGVARAQAPPRRPCPGAPIGPVGDAVGSATAHLPGGYGDDHLLGDTPGAMIWPVLQRLYELRARSAIPAGRSTHLEPGPA